MKRALLVIIVGALYVLHQDFWFWRTARPLVFGFIPIGLFYHACYTVVTAAVVWLLVAQVWPSHLEEGPGEEGGGEGPRGRRGDWAIGRLGEAETSRPVAPSPSLPLSSAGEGTER